MNFLNDVEDGPYGMKEQNKRKYYLHTKRYEYRERDLVGCKSATCETYEQLRIPKWLIAKIANVSETDVEFYLMIGAFLDRHHSRWENRIVKAVDTIVLIHDTLKERA